MAKKKKTILTGKVKRIKKKILKKKRVVKTHHLSLKDHISRHIKPHLTRLAAKHAQFSQNLGQTITTAKERLSRSAFSYRQSFFASLVLAQKFFSGKNIRKIHRKKVRLLRKKLLSLKKNLNELKQFILRHKYLATTSLTILLAVGFSLYWFLLKDLPSPRSLSEKPIPRTTIIRARDGQVLYRIYKDANRVELNWDEIPEVVKNATVAIEDADFYNHHGVSLRSILRAFLYNLKQSDINQYQGGSTITQQLIKNRLFGSKKSYARKVRELILAPLVELTYNKKEILTMYLNEVGYGGPAYGIEAASQMYFGRPAKDLNLAQASFLAGLPAAPTIFSPFGANSQLATIRQNSVLERMLKLKMINEDEYNKAKNEQLVFAPQKIDIRAPHFVMFVRDQLVQKFGEQMVTGGGLDVYTTLDLSLQEKAEEIVKKQVDQLKNAYHITNAASVITQPTTGEILAMVGSADYFDVKNQGYVNVATMPRQPGSSIKPVTYAYALDHGFTPNTLIEDSPVVYVAPGSTERYAPVNYDGKFHGTVSVRSALANSYNIPAVKTIHKMGVKEVATLGRDMGIRSWETPPKAGLSLTLGGAEVTMLDMARAYGTLANLGVRKELRVIKEIRDTKGSDLTERYYKVDESDPSLVSQARAETTKQVISPVSAYWITDILSDNAARLPAFGPYAKLTVPGHKIAVKTGTTNNFRDNWTIGYTPDYLVAAWVGNNDGSYMNKNLVSGITGAAPIWQEIMSNLLTETPNKDFSKPTGLVPVKICVTNGLLTCPFCPKEKTEYFAVDKIPTKQCSFRSASDCASAKTAAEDKSEEEKKQLLAGCLNTN